MKNSTCANWLYCSSPQPTALVHPDQPLRPPSPFSTTSPSPSSSIYCRPAPHFSEPSQIQRPHSHAPCPPPPPNPQLRPPGWLAWTAVKASSLGFSPASRVSVPPTRLLATFSFQNHQPLQGLKASNGLSPFRTGQVQIP